MLVHSLFCEEMFVCIAMQVYNSYADTLGEKTKLMVYAYDHLLGLC